MKKILEKIPLAFALILLSAGMYGLHYLVFKDIQHIFLYLLGDIAFLPLEILFVTLIFHKLLEDREKKNSLKKLNMLIGIFFSELGYKLLEMTAQSDDRLKQLQNDLLLQESWLKKDFQNALNHIEKHKSAINITNFVEIQGLLFAKREFMLKIIENPALLEHDRFSELMMSILHLEEELGSRNNLSRLFENDKNHLNRDIVRVYKMLLQEWLFYMQHLQKEYPYLFSLAVRTNPFDQNARAEIV
jgi:hypothetical protein